jgi:hypothetical protein
MRVEQHRALRPCSRAGGVWSRLRCAVGRLWRGHSGRRRAGREETARGVLGAFLFFPPFLTARVGAEGAGVDRGIVHEHGYRVETDGDSDPHSNLIPSDFLSARCSTQCPQEIQIRNFEIFHFGWSTY